jgi:hypothetical protein
MMMAVTIFDKLNERRPPVESRSKPEVSSERPQKIQHAQKLLNWLQRWSKPTVCAREIHIYGPYALRDPKIALSSAETLVRNGWLTPLRARRYDGHKWQIIRKPIVQPNVAVE